MSQEQDKKIELMLLEGNYSKVEEEIMKNKKDEAAEEIRKHIEKVINSEEGREIARKLQKKYGYKDLRRTKVTITTTSGDIKITSWYAVEQGKKMGRTKKGRNGRGAHLFLKYWGFTSKKSLNYTTKIARTGVACASYDLAQKELEENGYSISGNSVNNITQRTGELAQKHRDEIMLESKEDFTNKRLIISIDGGRVRTRENRAGRRKKDQKRAKYNSSWREPKLLVIAELDEDGNTKKNVKPIYEATMKNHDELFNLLENITKKCNLDKAKEIILSGDGARWIWNKYGEFAEKLNIKDKTTEILDFYHSTEHLTAICEENESLNKKEQKTWYNELRTLLWEGKFEDLKKNIQKESKEKKLPSLLRLFEYFENNEPRMHYDIYRNKKQPIGSGIVESAIRRVINLKLKSPSTFWKIDNIERVLQLRCILMSGRWKIFKQNFLRLNRFTV